MGKRQQNYLQLKNQSNGRHKEEEKRKQRLINILEQQTSRKRKQH